MREPSPPLFFLHGVLSLLLFVGLVNIFIGGRGYFFKLELLGLLVLIVLALLGMLTYGRGGKNFLFLGYLLYLGKLLLVWWLHSTLYVVLTALALVGFFLSLPDKEKSSGGDRGKKEEKKEERKEEPKVLKVEEPKIEEPHSMVFDQPKEAKSSKKVKAEFSPGKYVASISSNVYHVPICEWAERIHKGRRVWFDEKKDAWEKGYKKHSCVE